jgi:hypothetical protein
VSPELAAVVQSLRNKRADGSTSLGEIIAANEIERLSASEDALKKRVAELEARQRWIPVSERLPPVGENVLGHDCERFHTTIAWIDRRSVKPVLICTDPRYQITHWQAHPKAPEGG